MMLRISVLSKAKMERITTMSTRRNAVKQTELGKDAIEDASFSCGPLFSRASLPILAIFMQALYR